MLVIGLKISVTNDSSKRLCTGSDSEGHFWLMALVDAICMHAHFAYWTFQEERGIKPQLNQEPL